MRTCQCNNCIPATLAGLCQCEFDPGLFSTWEKTLRHYVIKHQEGQVLSEFARLCADDIHVVTQVVYQLGVRGDEQEALSWLIFIKLLHQNQREIENRQLLSSLEWVGSLSKPNPEIALVAAQITLLCLQRAPFVEEIAAELKTPLADLFPWSTISGINDENWDAYYRLWVKWLSLPAPLQPPQSVLQCDAYWSFILDGLRRGPFERQKLSLHILQRSISLIRQDIQTPLMSFPLTKIKAVEASINRYSRLFETIVIGRYSNQVEDCLKKFPAACFLEQPQTANFSLSSIWWRALLIAALNLQHSDNVRRLVGNWIIEQKIPDISFEEDFSFFLVGPVMKWSCQGHLFHNSLKREIHAVSCTHGSRWASFISRILRSSGDCKARSRFTIDILKAIIENVRHSHAIGFTLRGLDIYYHAASTFKDDRSLDDLEAIKTLTSEILANTDLTQLQNHIFGVFVQSILFCGSDLSAGLRRRNPSNSIAPFQDCHNIAEIRISLSSNDLSLPKRLFHACCRTDQILHGAHVDTWHESLPHLFDDIWRFSLQQDLPRTTLVMLPQIFFGSTSLQMAGTNKALREFLSDRLMDFLRLSQTRIYCWNPLASAIHGAYTTLPGLPSILPIQEFIVRFARKPPVATAAVLLDSAISQEIQDPAMRSQLLQPADEGIGYAMVFDMMNRLRRDDFHWGRSVIDILISPLTAESSSGNAAFLEPNTVLQSALLLSGRCFVEPEHLKEFRTKLCKSLTIGVNPVFRFLLEWLIVASYWSHPETINQSVYEMLEAIDDATEKDVVPRFAASLLRIGSCIAKHNQVDDEYLKRLSSTMLALCTSDKMAIRHEAGWSFWQLMDIARNRKLVQVSENATYKRIDRYIRSLKRFHDPTKFRVLQTFEPVNDQTLSFLVDGPYLHLDEGSVGVIHQEDFRKLYADPKTAAGVDLSPPYLPLGKPVERSIHKSTDKVVETSNPEMPFQSKSFLPSDETDEPGGQTKSRGGVILVASLIDSLFNLGGLCRAAEIFGCQELHIANISAVKESAFAGVSVSSENSIKITETKQDDLAALLRAKSTEGWSILGIEQTGSSLILGDDATKLPRRAVLVLGAEKTGMPAQVLAECDVCVEIKQWGNTRSLNVQTAAATVLYEWRRQWGDGR